MSYQKKYDFLSEDVVINDITNKQMETDYILLDTICFSTSDDKEEKIEKLD